MEQKEAKGGRAARAAAEKIFPARGRVRRVIAVMSGKGGVGKSTVSALLAVALAHSGLKTGILDADLTGPSIPRLFGLRGGVRVEDDGMVPATAALGIKVMSLNLLLPREDEPVIWRGPLVAATLKQLWRETDWGDLDVLVVDLPPGTGDVPLTVMQSLPLSGVVVVSSPQDLAAMVVRKAIKMARVVGAPLLGLVENMSYAVCPRCGEEIRLFGESRLKELAREAGVKLCAALPLDPKLAALADAGRIADYPAERLAGLASSLAALPELA